MTRRTCACRCRSILSGEGYELRLVESAEEALTALEKEEFFMVITDARLGSGMSGYQFLAMACKRWPNTPVPDDHRLRHAEAGGRSHQGRRH